MDTAVIAILAVSGVFSIACWVVLWRGTEHVGSKPFWSVVVAAPVVGPVLFAGLHNPPPVQSEVDRAAGGWDVLPDMSHPDTPGHDE